MSTPAWSLLIFGLLAVLSFFLFRKNGWFWIVRNERKKEERIWIEDILKLLYHSGKNNQSASLSAIAGALQLREGKALDFIQDMEEDELVEATSASIVLTEKGRKYALKIIRIHRLYEKYLSERTGFDKSEWHDLAEYMEHRMSKEETDDMAFDLGNPIYDPHGDPIPTSDGHVVVLDGRPLSKTPPGFIGKIIHIEDEPDVIYKQIIKADLYVGSKIKTLNNLSSKVEIYCEGEKFQFSPLVASNIMVKALDEGVELDEDIARLSALKENEEAIVIGINSEVRGVFRRRLLDLGFVPNTKIRIDNISPMNDPVAYIVKGSSIALRREQSSNILIKIIQKNGEET